MIMVFKSVMTDEGGNYVGVVEDGRMGLNAEGKLWVKGNSTVMEIARNPLQLPFGGTIDPGANPQEFLNALPQRYRGRMFWVEPIEDDSQPVEVPITIGEV